MIFLQQFQPMTAKEQAWAALQPQDDLTQAVYESRWWREQVRARSEQNDLAMAIIGELGIEPPIITKEEGKDLAICVRAFAQWCYGLDLTEYLGLPPCFTVQFLKEMKNAGARPHEVRALINGISYAHRRVFLSDPTLSPEVQNIIKRRKN